MATVQDVVDRVRSIINGDAKVGMLNVEIFRYLSDGLLLP